MRHELTLAQIEHVRDALGLYASRIAELGQNYSTKEHDDVALLRAIFTHDSEVVIRNKPGRWVIAWLVDNSDNPYRQYPEVEFRSQSEAETIAIALLESSDQAFQSYVILPAFEGNGL